MIFVKIASTCLQFETMLFRRPISADFTLLMSHNRWLVSFADVKARYVALIVQLGIQCEEGTDIVADVEAKVSDARGEGHKQIDRSVLAFRELHLVYIEFINLVLS